MTNLDFQRLMDSAKQNQVLIPEVHKMLYNPDFTGFDVHAEAWTPKPYDGWFHPSLVSTWTVRQLYLYLVAPGFLEEEHMPLTGVLAVTAGKFWHVFLQRLWLKSKTLIQDEVPVEDPSTNRRGHADGLLTNGEALEIKTINEFQISKVTSEAVLKEKKYAYWTQTQDYLDVLGLDVMRYFLMNPTYPFPMSEFTVRADRGYQTKRRAEYREAMQLAQQFPDHRELNQPTTTIPACCAPGSDTAKKCPTKRACPIGRFKT